MTHDEADHGLTAWAIVNGARGVYFTVGYGREPLYDYATALVMAGTGPTIFAARLTSAYFSLLMIAAVYAWARRAFGVPVALLSAAGLAVGFWPVMAGRQALRSIALPAVFALAVLFFWQGLVAKTQGRKGEGEKGGKGGRVQERSLSSFLSLSPYPGLLFLLAGLLLGLSFYTYIPARVLWLAFPALAVYLTLAATPDARRGRPIFQGTMLTLVVALLVAAPLLLYLADNPGVEVRIDELSAPLAAAAAGDFAPLWANALGALKLFTVEGDQTWRYNIPGKPFLGPVMGVLFYAGLLVAAWLVVWNLRNRVSKKKLGFSRASVGPGAFLALVWLALGMAPVLVTGPGLSVTQAIGALPVLYVFPALAMAAGWHGLTRLTADRRRSAAGGLLIAVTVFALLAAQTARDYFGRWANEPDVRVQYEATMVAALRYLDEHGRGAAAVSTITPGRYHTPAVALLTLHNPDVRPRWFDGRESLLLPGQSRSLLLIPGFTPIPAALQPFLDGATLIDQLPMRPDDLDRPVEIYELSGESGAALSGMESAGLPVRFEDHIELLGYDLSATAARPGDTLTLVTAWRLLQPLPDASLFAHVIGPGEPLAVADSLGAPGEAWIAGDVLYQLHTLTLPRHIVAGEYPLAVGVYTRADGRRLVASTDQDMVPLLTLVVSAKAGDE
jgi:4-amino-4-deoxy-L-arabinose transferase-like glycosyltransferase